MNNELQEMPFVEHLEVFRKMLIRIALVLLVLSVAVFCLKDPVFSLLLAPKEYDFVTFRAIEHLLHTLGSSFRFEPYHIELISVELSGQFMAHLETALALATLIASPYILTELFCFVTPALYENEKRYSVTTAVLMYLLFVAGVLMSYFVLFPIAFRFLGTYQVSTDVVNTITLSSYISTFISLTLMMGLVFQLPIVSFFLGKVGILSANAMQKYRRHALVGIMVTAALITPPDIFTMVLVTFPLYLLYEVSIQVVKHSSK